MAQKLDQQLWIDFGVALVLSQVTRIVSLGKYPHDGAIQADGVHERLKDGVTVFRAISMLAESRER